MMARPVATIDGQLPAGWAIFPLRKLLSSFELGGNYPNTLSASDFPLMKMGNLERGRFDVSKVEYVSSGVIPSEHHRLHKGDVLFNTRNTLDLVGKIAIWRDELDSAYFNSNLMRLKLNPEIIVSNEFANLALNSARSVSSLRSMATGTTSVAAIYTRDLMTLPVVVPPPNEQQAIAAALSDADGVVAGLERVIAKKRLIKQGAMQDLLTARRRLPGFSGEWEVKGLGSLGVCLRGVSYDGSTDLFEAETRESIMLLRANNVQNGEIVYSDVQHVRKERVKPVQHLKRGDVLVCMANGSRTLVGKAGVFWEDGGATFTFGAFMGCFRPAPGAAADGFVPFLFQSDEYRNQLNVILSGSAINNLAPSQILAFSFKMPVDHSEQQAIAAVLSDMDAEIKTLDSRLAKARAVKEGMMQNLLTGRVRLV